MTNSLIHSSVSSLPQRSEFSHHLLSDYSNPDDYLSQDSIHAHRLSFSEPPPADESWRKATKTIKTVRLSFLKMVSEQDTAGDQMQFLNTPLKVSIDEEYLIPPNAAVYAAQHRLDFFSILANKMGFGIILPPANLNVSNSFTFRLDLSHHLKALKLKVRESLYLFAINRESLSIYLSPQHGDFGYDPTGAVLFIGVHEGMNVYLVMADTDTFENPSKRAPAGKTWSGGSTAMSARHRMMILTWFLYTMSLAKICQVRVRPENLFKADLSAGAKETWSFASNFE